MRKSHSAPFLVWVIPESPIRLYALLSGRRSAKQAPKVISKLFANHIGPISPPLQIMLRLLFVAQENQHRVFF
jgi:hypothetical protein